MLLEPGSRDVLVVAGLPGAGKTTLAASEPRALDSDDVRTAWAPRMAGIPYPLWRPLAHAWHWLALWRALGRADGVVVVRPFTSGRLRRAVLRRARRHHRAPNKPSHPGATIARTETDGDSAAPYESHITTSARQGARGPRQQGLRGHRGTRASRSPVAPSRLGARRRA